MKKIMGKLFLALTLVFMFCMPVAAGDLGLVDLLSSQLGVSKDQASGGAGSIFNLAKKNLSGDDFSAISKAVPGIDKMTDAAPEIKENSAALGAVSSLLGDKSDSLGDLAGLATAFEKLDMSGDMVGKFTPIILDYVKTNGSEHVMNLLKNALL